MPPKKRPAAAATGGKAAGKGSSAASGRHPVSHGWSPPPDAPEGPRDALEVFNWPADILGRTIGLPGAAESTLIMGRLRGMCHHTQWCFTSDYSGFDCPREAIRLGHASIKRTFPQWCLGPFASLRACDNEELPQQVLKKMSRCC